MTLLSLLAFCVSCGDKDEDRDDTVEMSGKRNKDEDDHEHVETEIESGEGIILGEEREKNKYIEVDCFYCAETPAFCSHCSFINGICPDCGGKGYVDCTRCPSTGKCGKCYGRGTYVDTSYGLGVREKTCYSCNGSGRCTSCSGTGTKDCSYC